MTSSEPYHTSWERSAKVPFLLMLWKTPSSSKLSAPCRQQAQLTTLHANRPRPYAPYTMDSPSLANYSSFIANNQSKIWSYKFIIYKITWQLYEAMKFTSRCAQHLGTTPSPSWPWPSPHTCRSPSHSVMQAVADTLLCICTFTGNATVAHAAWSPLSYFLPRLPSGLQHVCWVLSVNTM